MGLKMNHLERMKKAPEKFENLTKPNHSLSIAKFYSEKNRETTESIDKFLVENFSDLGQEVAFHIKRRKETSRTKLKSFFVRMGFEIANDEGKGNWKSIIPLCSLVELLNIANYQIERGIEDNDQEKIVFGQTLRDVALKSNFLNETERKYFREMIDRIDQYLVIDNKILLWDNKRLHQLNKKSFLKEYENKCFLVGGQFYATCLELGFLRSGSKREVIKNCLCSIGKRFGTAYQMVHEVADLLPPQLKRFPEDFKYYQNQYNSLRKHKLTLPIYFALYEWKDFDKSLFFNLLESQNYAAIAQIFVKSKIVKKSKSYARAYVKPLKKEFRRLPDNKWTNCLEFATNSINSNIFWKHFKKLYAEVA